MFLKGSCHCGAVRFSLESQHPYPFMRCYCAICRKTAGGGGYVLNIGGEAESLKVIGEEFISRYQAMMEDDSGNTTQSPAQRNFCKQCGSALWVWDPRWPELIHPFASAIDTDLPVAPEHTHLMLAFKAGWVPLDAAPGDKVFDRYPQESIADWHQRLNLVVPE
ncbi:MAG: alanine acetyltransferase [marine bacterium B5-7]|nr:MAG: alanine acetyltransferase [marine bacterium B5-7]